MFLSTYFPLYTINFPRYWLVRDEPIEDSYSSLREEDDHTELIFHISSGDYLPTLATILRFFEETVYENKISPSMREIQLRTIRSVIENLLYLDKHYVILPKDGQKPE